MKFEQFFIAVLQYKRLNMNDLYTFIAEYCNICGKQFDSQKITVLCNLIQNGNLDLDFAIRNYCKLKNLTIYTIKHLANNLFPQDEIIKVYLREDK